MFVWSSIHLLTYIKRLIVYCVSFKFSWYSRSRMFIFAEKSETPRKDNESVLVYFIQNLKSTSIFFQSHSSIVTMTWKILNRLIDISMFKKKNSHSLVTVDMLYKVAHAVSVYILCRTVNTLLPSLRFVPACLARCQQVLSNYFERWFTFPGL